MPQLSLDVPPTPLADQFGVSLAPSNYGLARHSALLWLGNYLLQSCENFDLDGCQPDTVVSYFGVAHAAASMAGVVGVPLETHTVI